MPRCGKLWQNHKIETTCLSCLNRAVAFESIFSFFLSFFSFSSLFTSNAMHRSANNGSVRTRRLSPGINLNGVQKQNRASIGSVSNYEQLETTSYQEVCMTCLSERVFGTTVSETPLRSARRSGSSLLAAQSTAPGPRELGDSVDR